MPEESPLEEGMARNAAYITAIPSTPSVEPEDSATASPAGASESIAPDESTEVDGELEEGVVPFFVGNSLVEGLRLNSDDGYPFYCEVGISLPTLNRKLALPDDYDIAIIEMGSNELGAYSEESFKNSYQELIEILDCPCYCLSIPPINWTKSRMPPVLTIRMSVCTTTIFAVFARKQGLHLWTARLSLGTRCRQNGLGTGCI